MNSRTIATFNNLMSDMCREENTIGTSHSEDTENWNLRDMVAECDYILGLYFEEGTTLNNSLTGKYDSDWDLNEKEKAEAKAFVTRLKRFISSHKDEAMTMVCATRHSSQYD